MTDFYQINNFKFLPGNLSKQFVLDALNFRGDNSFRLKQIANEIKKQVFGNTCYIRAVIEITNKCDVDCKYCSISFSAPILRYFG